MYLSCTWEKVGCGGRQNYVDFARLLLGGGRASGSHVDFIMNFMQIGCAGWTSSGIMLASCGVPWYHVVSGGVTWCHVESGGVT